MDLAYDHIAEQSFSPGDRATTPTPASNTAADPSDPTATPKASNQPPRQNLQTELQETFKAFSNSPWGAKLGGFWGNVRKQSESYYEEARKEAAEVASEVEALRTKGLAGLGFGEKPREEPAAGSDATGAKAAEGGDKDGDLQETETFLERFKTEAAKRLRDVQRAEDAADEALLRFGTNIRNFLRDAIAVTGPEDDQTDQRQSGEVLFESKDPSGKRVIHTSRFDAQLHVIHTNPSSFSQDPSGADHQWDEFKQSFDIDSMTDKIAQDLDKHGELRRSMEKLVPETVDYKDFWTRYYFLKHVVEVQEEKRKELLKASTHDAEEVGWDEDSDDEPATSSTPQLDQGQGPPPKVLVPQNTNDSSTTIHQTPPPTEASTLKPDGAGRRSHDEKSVAESDASYDLVSGATSRAPGSPKDDVGKATAKIDESDEEDWE